MKINHRYCHITFVAIIAAVMAISSCNEKKFQVTGNITDAKDSILYFEHMSLNGPETTDSVKLTGDGSFSFSGKDEGTPEFYRLRIAGQIINIAVDSTETIEVNASYPTMASGYDVKGSYDCSKIKELALMQMQLQRNVNAIAADPTLNVQAVTDSINKVVAAYKYKVKNDYIFKEPMKAYAYFALFQTINMGYQTMLIFNPRNSEDDVKVFAAVATSWDTFYPKAERGANLHNIALEGMKNVRIIRSEQAKRLDPKVIDTSGIIEIALKDNKGIVRRLSDLKGKVVLLDFHLFSADGSADRIMMLRDIYNKYHKLGLEIYQVSVDTDEHFWKTQTAALPWISVRVDDNSASVLNNYNVQAVPTFFLLNKNVNVVKRDAQIKDIDAEIKALL